ncbi:MAG: acyl-CoA dehydrogenase family protein [Pseudomonadota bacterium]
MDFEDSPEEAQFRQEVYAWLAENAPLKKEGPSSARDDDHGSPQAVAAAKAWQATKAARGFAQIPWPKEWGGPGGAPIQQVIYNQEEAKFDVPRMYFEIGLGMCVPTVLTYCDPAFAKPAAERALKGDEIWCQLFSEPAAGSDSAGVQTKAVRDGEDWVINGQKVWTSGAHFCDYGIILTRTDPDAPKHKGLTMFWIDMKDPAVECRPIKQMSGASHFNEVYLNDLRVKDSQRIGELNGGWGVAVTTLMFERLAVGGGDGGSGPGTEAMMALARETQLEEGPALQDRAVRERIAEWHVRAQGLKFTTFRTITALSKGQTPGPEASIGKLVSANTAQERSDFALDLQDMAGLLMGEEATHDGQFQDVFLAIPGLRIAGGTDEILKNVIAERVLGLPGDARVDKNVPFKDVPKGG